MKINFIIAQLMGLLALVFLVYSFQNNNKKTLLKFQVVSSFLYAMQYLFLGAYTGCLMNIVCMIRNYLFKEYEDVEISLRWLLIILGAMSLLMMFSYDGYVSLLPFFAVLFFTIALWVGNLRFIRIFEAIGALLFIIYSVLVYAVMGVFAFSFELSTVLFAIYRFDIKKNKNKKG
ncbi:MAG: YgjV family protein [Bacilli bacterium]|nr:YgjV family protein [Bacilli bacterium]